jgi:cysteine-rich repeat protein
MMANWKIKMMIVPAFAFAACIIVGGARVASATLAFGTCTTPTDGGCKGGAPNGVVQQGEQCDDGNTMNNDGCDTNCTTPCCGNGITDLGEECDNGTANDDVNVDAMPAGNACDTSCRTKACGNGRVEGGELCDDGNTFNNDGCDSDPNSMQLGGAGLCLGSGCGNGITNMNEMPDGCDDGNTIDNDACNNNCMTTYCGDGISDIGELCDDANTVDDDYCSNDCLTDGSCGDTVVQAGAGEECDDGNTENLDACRNDCTTSRCGDGISDIGEACDDGNTIDDATCLGDCSKVPVCGDGVSDANECCDDGACACVAPKHAANGKSCATQAGRDACAADGGTCTNTATMAVCGVAAGDGNLDDIADACRSTCECPSCGDGVSDTGEGCDDGLNGPAPAPVDDTDACANGPTAFATGMACMMANTCGDGNPNSDATGGNTCDNGEGTQPKTCASSGTPCSVNADCGGSVCGNSDGAGGTCHTTGFTDAECPNGPAAGDCACHPHYCGDGVTDTGEGCDDGNTSPADCNPAAGSGDACTTNADCTGEICTGGACHTDCAGLDICSSTCALATCGDGITQTGEACDDGAQNGMVGNNAGGADCTKKCTANVCGDGEALDTELCDDGNSVNTDDCLNSCVPGACGDGVTRTTGSSPLEQCDDGNTSDDEGANGGTDGCTGHCCWESTVALPTADAMLAAQQCNLDFLAQEIAALPNGRAKRRLTRHMATALKLSAQASAALTAGSTKKACRAEKRKNRVTVCIQRALDLGLVRGEIDATTHREITQKNLNVHGWVENVQNKLGCN